MTKSEFISTLAAATDMKKSDVERVIAAAANTLTGVMRSSDCVNISGFGIFTSKVRDAHPGKNPATGEAITVPAKRVAIFKPAKQLKDAVNS